jgi:hypothetical protein
MGLDNTFGFWHPFGTHAGESRDAILARKRREIDANGWTLWSFQHRRTLDMWRGLLPASSVVFALCSDSPTARDAKAPARQARFYRASATRPWEPIPAKISVPHPVADPDGLGSAFVVEEIVMVDDALGRLGAGVSWFSTATNEWRSDPVPTRGEYLLRAPGPVQLRPIYAGLRLRFPFLVELQCSIA